MLHPALIPEDKTQQVGFPAMKWRAWQNSSSGQKTGEAVWPSLYFQAPYLASLFTCSLLMIIFQVYLKHHHSLLMSFLVVLCNLVLSCILLSLYQFHTECFKMCNYC